MDSKKAITDGFIPYPYTFPAIRFTVESKCGCDESCLGVGVKPHPQRKEEVCEDCWNGLDAEMRDDALMHYHAGVSIDGNSRVD